MDAFTLVAKLTLNRDEFDQGLRQVEGTLNSKDTKGSFSAWGVTVGNLAAQAFTKVFRSAVNFAKSILSTGMNFDQMMGYVKATGSMSEQEFEKVRQKAIDLGASTKFTAKEVGEAFYYMRLAGWDTEEMLSGIEGVLNLAAASGEDLWQVSDIVTDAITALGLSAEDTARFVNVLAAASSNSNTTVGMMGEAFKYLATTGGVLEYSIEDVATVLGLLANNGIKAGQAGTSMRQILNTLINPTDKAAAAMQNLGLSLFDMSGENGMVGGRKPLMQVVQELRQIFQEADFDLGGKPLAEVQAKIDELNAAWDEQYESMKKQGASKREIEDAYNKYLEDFKEIVEFNPAFLSKLGDIGGLRGISSLFALMKSTEEDVNQLVDAVNTSGEGKGTAAEMAATMLDNLKGDVTILNSAIDGLKIAMFDDINPAAREFVQNLTDGVTAITNLIKHGKLTWTVEDEEREAVNNAERSAIEASGLVDYMDSLIKKYGDAADKSGEWATALSRLQELIPGITNNIQSEGQALSDTTASMRDYIDVSKQKAIEDAKRATIADYTKRYNEAQAELGQAQINQYIAEAEAGAARQAMIDYIGRTQPGFTGKNMTIEQIISAAYATANELGESADYIKTLENTYKNQTEASEKYKTSIEQLTVSSNTLKTQLDIAQKAVEQMVRDMTSSGYQSYGAWKTEQMIKQYGGSSGFGSGRETNVTGSANYTTTTGYYGSDPVGKRQAKGDWYVPYDDYPSLLHRGEMVLTASQARQFREGGSGVDIGALTTAIVGAVQEGLRNAQVTSYLDGRNVTDMIAKRMGDQLMLAR